MTIVHRAAFVASLAGALAGTLHEVNDASAFGIRRPAAECFLRTTDPQSTMYEGQIVGLAGVSTAYCPIPEDAYTGPAAIKTVNVHGYNGNSKEVVVAQVCWINWSYSGGGCRNLVKAAPTLGDFTLSLGAPKFSSVFDTADTANFKHIEVRLTKTDVSAPSTLRGIYFGG